MALKVLNKTQVEHFLEFGWVKLEEAYTEKQALAAQEVVWRRLEQHNVYKNDPTTWTEPMVRMRENYDTPEFRACKTQRLIGAVEDLVGEDRWINREQPIQWGWWPVNFASGADMPWDVPTTGWHIDGIHDPQYIDSPEQGLLLLCMFSEVEPQGGGTVVANRSHNIIAKVFEDHPEGLNVKQVMAYANEHPWLKELTDPSENSLRKNESRIDFFMNKEYTDENGISLRVVETTGSPGDIILGHPFLYHASSQNHSGFPRFMCNNRTSLFEKLNLERTNEDDYSILEISIKQALANNRKH